MLVFMHGRVYARLYMNRASVYLYIFVHACVIVSVKAFFLLFFFVSVRVCPMPHVFFLADVAECARYGVSLCVSRHACFGVCVVLCLLVFRTHSLFFLRKHACSLFLSLSFAFFSYMLVCACSLALSELLTISVTKPVSECMRHSAPGQIIRACLMNSNTFFLRLIRVVTGLNRVEHVVPCFRRCL